MENNPYAPPTANIELPDTVLIVPPNILKKIKHAWIACVISGCITLIYSLLAISGKSILGYSAWELVDTAFVFALAFGIYKKSRTCAVLMLVYFIASKIILIEASGKFTGIFLALIFIYCYVQGVIGTFQYHRFLRNGHTANTLSS